MLVIRGLGDVLVVMCQYNVSGWGFLSGVRMVCLVGDLSAVSEISGLGAISGAIVMSVAHFMCLGGVSCLV